MNNTIKNLTFAALVVTYSFAALAYVENKFVNKEVFELICNKLDKIEAKLDRLMEEKIK